MKRKLNFRVSLLIPMLVLALSGSLMAQTTAPRKEGDAAAKTDAASPTPREFKDFLRSVEKDLGKMRIGRNKPEVIDELSKQLGAAEGNRDVTLKFKVTKLETQDTNQGKRSRIFSRTERVRLDGINLNIFIFVYISDEVRKQLGKLKAGDEIIATGTVSKTEFDIKDVYRLTIDLKDSKVTVVN